MIAPLGVGKINLKFKTLRRRQTCERAKIYLNRQKMSVK
jgi:hypothetical protein